MKKSLFFILMFLVVSGCAEKHHEYSLPKHCNGHCSIASDSASFYDAVINSSFQRSDCICIKGVLEDIQLKIDTPLTLAGKKDASSGISSGNSSLVISGKEIHINNLILTSSGKSAVEIKDAEKIKIDKVRIIKKAGSDEDTAAVFIEGSRNVEIKSTKIELLSEGSKNNIFGIYIKNSPESILENILVDGLGNKNTAGINIYNSSLRFKNLNIVNTSLQGLFADKSDIKGETLTLKNMTARSASLFIRNSKVDISEAEIENISICPVFSTGGKGVIFDGKDSGGSVSGLSVSQCDSNGVLLNDIGSLSMSEIILNNNLTGIWGQFRHENNNLQFKNVEMSENLMSGFYFLGPCRLNIENADIKRSKKIKFMNHNIGDGIVVASRRSMDEKCSLEFSSIKLHDNERAGMIFDSIYSSENQFQKAIKLKDISITGAKNTETRYGVVFQNGERPAEILDGIIYNEYEKNDSERVDNLGIVYDFSDF